MELPELSPQHRNPEEHEQIMKEGRRVVAEEDNAYNGGDYGLIRGIRR